jgi:hypothetical protein
MRFFSVGHFEFFLSKKKKKIVSSQRKQADHSYELSFFSALWMVFSESWKRGCPNYVTCKQL